MNFGSSSKYKLKTVIKKYRLPTLDMFSDGINDKSDVRLL